MWIDIACSPSQPEWLWLATRCQSEERDCQGRPEVDWNPCRIAPSDPPPPFLFPGSARLGQDSPIRRSFTSVCGRLLSQPPAINHVIWQRLQTGRRSSFLDPFRQRIHVLVIQRLTPGLKITLFSACIQDTPLLKAPFTIEHILLLFRFLIEPQNFEVWQISKTNFTL